MKYSGERFLPEECKGEIAVEHYQRYQLAVQLAEGKTVLDAACGEGYGSSLLAERAGKVVGLDIDEDTVACANEKYGNDKLSYVAGSIEKLPFDDFSFDMIVSYETIEHVEAEIQQAFLKEIKRVLKPDGILIMSTPNKKVYTDSVSGHNQFHIKEFYVEEFIKFLGEAFRNVEAFCQFPDIGYFITDGTAKVKISHESQLMEKSRYIVAICSDFQIECNFDLDRLVHFDDSMYYSLYADVHRMEDELTRTKKEADLFQGNLEHAISDQKEYILKLEKDILNQKEYARHLEHDLSVQKEYTRQLEEDGLHRKEESDRYTSQLEKDIVSQKEYISHLEKDIKAQEKDIKAREKDIKSQESTILQLEKNIEEQKEYVSHLEHDLNELTGYTRHLEKDIEILNEQVKKAGEARNVRHRIRKL